MKKFMFGAIALFMVAMVSVSCNAGSATSNADENDTVAATVTDSVLVDSVVADSIVTDSTVVLN